MFLKKFFFLLPLVGLLTTKMLAQVEQIPPPITPPTYVIAENLYDKDTRYLQLNDGSFWVLNYNYGSFWDRFSGKDAQANWLSPQRIEISYSKNHKFPYLLHNIDNNETVEARQFNPYVFLYAVVEKMQGEIQQLRLSQEGTHSAVVNGLSELKTLLQRRDGRNNPPVAPVPAS